MIKILKQESKFLISNKILFSNNCSFSTSYPYKFGGVGSPKHFKGSQQFLVSTFGNQIFDNFREAYRATLQALVQKDTVVLQAILQPNLMKDIAFKDVELVGSQQLKSIDIITGKTGIILGAGFERSTHKGLKVFSAHEQYGVDMMFSGNMMNPKSSSIPFLFSFNIFFNGHMKLIRAGDKKKTKQIVDDLPQMHSVQFEVQTERSPFEMMKLMSSFQKMAEKGDKQLAIFADVIGKDYEWKIGDIDNVLNRNFNIS